MTTFTRTSPTTGGLVPAAVTEIGGIVLDLVGLNGVRVVTQLSASSLFVGSFATAVGTIGTATGISNAILGVLGGGLSEVAVRVTLEDGDTAAGNFDENQNTLLLNGVNLGNFSAVSTQRTSSNGSTLVSSGFGFGDDILATGWFYSNSTSTLQSLFSSLSNGQVVFAVNDVDPGDNFYDFKQGLDGGLIDVGSLPNTSPNAQNDSASGLANSVIKTGNVLLNDVDLETVLTGESITGFSGGANGTVSYNGDGTFNYTPTAGFTGVDSFTYTVSDGALTDTATVRVSINPIAPPPPPNGLNIINGTRDADPSLLGTRGRDDISGFGGDDNIFARQGDDVLRGQGGNDRLDGGEGNDQMYGGVGADQFRLDGRVISETDTDFIYDLSFAEGDTVVFASFAANVFDGVPGGNSLQLISGGTGAIIDSYEDLAELVATSTAVTASTRAGAIDLLILTVTDADGDIQSVHISNALAAYGAAGGQLLI